MKKELRCAVDIDGVCVDFCHTYLRILKDVVGIDKKYEDIVSFDFSKLTSKEDDKKVWDYIDNTPGVVYDVPEIKDAFKGIEYLRTLGRVVAVTSPHLGPTWMWERTRVLQMNFGFSKKDIVFCSDKYLVPADIFIEDSLENVNTYIEHHPKALVFLMETPYNQGKTKAIRVKDWAELLTQVHYHTNFLTSGS